MGSSNICWGIEMGYGAIKALKIETDGTNCKVLDYAIINHPKVLSTPELDQTDAMRVALGTLVTQHDLSGARVAISMPGHQSFARFAKLPPVEPKKVPDIVKFEAVQQIPFPLEEVEWDYQTFVSPDSPDIEVGIFAVTRQRIAEQLSMLNDVGLTPDTATLSPVAAYNALAADLGFTDDTPGTIIIDIGTVATDLIIAEAGRVWVRTFPIGGHQFTEALVNSFKLSYSKAEKLKREAEQSKHARHVFQAMRPVFSDLVQEIQRSIGFYQSVHADCDLKRLIGLGSTFRLPGLRKYLKQQLNLDVYRLEQFKKLSFEGPRAGEFQAASFNMATAYGCVLQAFDQAPLRANLMPVQVLKDAMWKRKVPYFAAAAGIAAAAAGAMFIRPLLDSSAFEGAEKPGVIARVIRDAGTLASDAASQGVTDGAESDLAAAQIVGLLDNRALYTNLLDDTARLISLVESKAQALAAEDSRFAEAIADGPAISLMSLETNYMPGGAESIDRGFGGRGGQPGNTASVDERLAAIAGRSRVEMVGQFEIASNNLDVFMLDILEPILRDQIEREGIGYTITVGTQPWVVTSGATGGRGTAGFTSGRQPSSGRGGMVAIDPGRTPTSLGGSTNVDSLAPLVEPAEPQTRTTATVTVTWFAVLDQATNAAGDEG
ncbi:MAG: type IV pilus assembly protein PilM [Phycisphaerales bacterium]|nr:type IV pilus assembly protein PilM [Phycisphaerales bacterium]